MKYRFTVWNCIIILLIPIITYILIKQTADDRLIIAAAFLIPILFIGAIIDFVLQIIIEDNRVLAVVEIVALFAILVINNM